MQNIINLQKGFTIVSISYKFHSACVIINLNSRDKRVARNGGSRGEIIIYKWPKQAVLLFIKHYPNVFYFYEVTSFLSNPRIIFCNVKELFGYQ